MRAFVHLHVHSEYSLLDGAARIKELVQRAAQLGMSALALTDHGVMHGAVPFYKACLEHGIKPIIGCEMYFTSGALQDKLSRQEQPIYHLIVLAKNMAGYRNLMRLSSIAHLEGYHYRPRINLEHLKANSEGLVVLSSCLAGEVSQHLLHDRYEQAKAAAERFKAVFGDDYYLEIQDHGMYEQKKVMQQMIRLSEETGIPLVATNDVHYVFAEDQAVQDILVCIGTGKTLNDEERLQFHTDQLYLKSGEEMARLFPHVQEALDRTNEVAAKCNLELQLGTSILPAFSPLPPNVTAEQYLLTLCEEGLLKRYSHLSEWSDVSFVQMAQERLRYEWSVITRMGFADYFLIVWDFIRFAREHSIPIGPGRGSSAGSLVAYSLGITDVDPLKYQLLFERFLNPERVSMPDIDIDFSDERRDEVIDYVAQKYGKEHVAQIITFGTMAARAAVRDVGRVLNIPYNEVDRAAKLIPNQFGMTIANAVQQSTDLQTLAKNQQSIAELLDYAQRVEGFPRHASTHAAGVVISREPLTHYTPLQAGTEHIALTQYSMENLEAIGLLKMDFLGLRTLSIIERATRFIEEQHGIKLDFNIISDEDPLTYELLGKGETTGIFQLESPGMRRVLRELKPTTFEDIISVLALYRPGPMEFIPKYIQGKHGLIEIDYPHPSLEPILADTYGIIVYQEQIMQIASSMAGFSLGEADLLRRAVSKKKREVLDEERAHFVQGCVKQGYTEPEGHIVYDMIVRFADYGFPRAHAAAYAVVAFQTAYLKAHYPAQFMAAMLTSVIGNQRKVAEYADECRRMGIPVLSPDINQSGETFTPVLMDGGWSIRFGLGAIRNVGISAIEAILTQRAEALFVDLPEFCQRIDHRVCNKRVIESLILGGAFDTLPGHRAQQLAMLDDCIELAVKWKKERDDLQLHLFGFTEQANWSVDMPNIPPYTAQAKLDFEREMLGMYLSGHPLDAYEEIIAERGAIPIHHLADMIDGRYVQVAGMILNVKTIISKSGKPMAFLELEDRIDKVEVVVFPDRWQRYNKILSKGALIWLQAKLQHNDEDVSLLAEHAFELEALPVKLPPLPTIRERAAGAAPFPGRRSPVAASQAKVQASSSVQTAAALAGAQAAPAAAKEPIMISSTSDLEEKALQRILQTDIQGGSFTRLEPVAKKASTSSTPKRNTQRLFIKITAEHENAEQLRRLQQLLQEAKGANEVVMFYERQQKSLVLSEQYNVKPSPELFQRIEELLGKGTVRIR